jgi:hypothetical protein
MARFRRSQHLFMKDAAPMIGASRTYYNMFVKYGIRFVQVLCRGRLVKAYRQSDVQWLAGEVQAGRVSRF